MNLCSDVLDLVVAFGQSVLPVVKVQKHVMFLLLAYKQRVFAPRCHQRLDLLHIVLGLLHSGLQVDYLISRLLNVLPHIWNNETKNYF